jgi:hypothetical protein
MPDDQPAATKLIDLAAVALSPVLVALMVGSLVFFLTEVGYRGQYPGRMLWTLCFFVAGCVLIARLSIQEGRGHAALYAGGLAVATLLALLRFSGDSVGLVGSLVLMPLIWWATDTLVWDCTHLDEGRKASGRGLLAAAGLDDVSQQEPDDDPPPKGQPAGWLERFAAYRAARNKRPHTPGLWVLYFALAALPIFALGQSLIDPADTARRRACFAYMAVYVGSALGLLVTTSLMGLRKYLEERGARVPAALTLGWLGLGGGLILGFLVVAALLPRPHSETPLLGMSRAGNTPPPTAKADDRRQASKNAAVRDGSAGKGEGAKGTKTEAGDGKASAKGGKAGGDGGEKGSGGGKGKSDGGRQQEKGEESGEKADEPPQPRQGQDQKSPADRSEAKASDRPAEKGQADDPAGQPAEQSSGDSGPSAVEKLTEAVESAGDLLRWVVWALVALAAVGVVVFLAVKGLAPFTDWAKRLLDWWRGLFAAKPAAGGGEAAAGGGEAVVDRPPPFVDFRDPFADGSADRRKLPELVTYTFAAVDSWAWERGRGRRPGETPQEFVVRLGQEFEPLDEPGFKLAGLYARAVYGRGRLPADARRALAEVWRALGRGRR